MSPSFRLTFLLWPLFSAAFDGHCQQNELKNERQTEELVEAMAAVGDAGTETTLLLDDLGYYATHPLYINKATEAELMRFNFLNFRQVQCIMTYRKRYSKIMTLKELAVTGDFSEELLLKMQPYVRFDAEEDSLQKRRSNAVHQSLVARIKTSFPFAEGYRRVNGKVPVYPGNPFGYYARYHGEIGARFEMGFTAENDAGEDFFRKSNKNSFDFLSGFLSWNGKGLVRKIMVGDFHLRFGQGVNLWSGGGVSYASDPSSLMRTGEGIRPYGSTGENLFFRGGAVLLALKSARLSCFYSDKHRDANLEADPSGGPLITSLRLDGLHRTKNEVADEKVVRERVFGIYSDFRFSKWRFGMLANGLQFGFPVTRGSSPYKSKSFEGSGNFNFGLDYHLIFNQINIFGEAGVSQNLRIATINGVVWKPHPQLSLSFLYRYYDPGFQSFYSGSFAEGSSTRNEKGLFAAFELYPVSKVKITGQSDLFYYPWLTYQTMSPALGQILAFQVESTIRSDLVVYLHSRLVRKPRKLVESPGVPEQWDESTSKWRIHGDWRINEKIQLRSRIEYVDYRFNQIRERGYLAYQDFIYSPSPALKIWLRMTGYHTDGYNSRIYTYENDLLYCYAIPEFQGKGIRSYVNLKWQPSGLISIFLKTGYTLRAGALSMGSGNDATPGDYRIDLKGEICLKF